jgi:hypothetical protein
MKDRLKALGLWALARSQERSTYAGLAMVAGALLGHEVPEHTVQVISFVGQFVGAGLIAASTKQAC